ncbi:MAG: sel1 repeat family protein [Alteromonadaceae bacterium]|nr:sel1 repeat family protein [Alteromonadaceae bacterium]
MPQFKHVYDFLVGKFKREKITNEQIQQHCFDEAKQGVVESMFCYAFLCLGYSGFKKSIGHTEYYLNLAANKGHSEAQYYLGLFYYEGEVFSKDIEKGAFWLKISAVNGNTDAEDYLEKLDPLTINIFPSASSSNLI